MEIASTERLRLRTVTVDDAPFYLALVNDPAFIEHIGDRNIRTLDEARRAVETGPVAMQEERGHSLYLVELKDSGAAIGMCGLIKRESLLDVDIGYALLPEYRGRGYAYEAAAAVMAYARTLGLKRLAGITSPANLASNLLLQKLGLRFQYFTYLDPAGPGSNVYLCEFDAGRLDTQCK